MNRAVTLFQKCKLGADSCSPPVQRCTALDFECDVIYRQFYKYFIKPAYWIIVDTFRRFKGL